MLEAFLLFVLAWILSGLASLMPRPQDTMGSRIYVWLYVCAQILFGHWNRIYLRVRLEHNNGYVARRWEPED